MGLNIWQRGWSCTLKMDVVFLVTHRDGIYFGICRNITLNPLFIHSGGDQLHVFLTQEWQPVCVRRLLQPPPNIHLYWATCRPCPRTGVKWDLNRQLSIIGQSSVPHELQSFDVTRKSSNKICVYQVFWSLKKTHKNGNLYFLTYLL